MTELDDIRRGVLRFRRKVFPENQALFESLAHHQDPQILFITCIDSRVDPAMLCDADPGDMFVERTPGNIIPVHAETRSGISASIEYAVTALRVSHIVICGHSDCGALKAALHPEKLEALPAVARWMHYSDAAVEAVNASPKAGADEAARLHALCEQNVRVQMEHLQTHPSVRRRLEAGNLTIHGWTYQIHSGEVYRYDAARQTFALWPEEVS